MSYTKIGIIFTLMLLILGGAFYLGVVQGVTGLVTEANSGFISLLPQEAKWSISIILLGILIGLIYSFIRE